ncbi:YjhX family toxin [Consotaella sp. CSK11QG-6]
MNISRGEQRVLHVLAKGGFIRYERRDNGKITDIECYTRDGYRLLDCTPDVFSRLRRKRLIESRSSQPYRINRRGREAVRSQSDNR